jgi:hypothetical protein
MILHPVTAHLGSGAARDGVSDIPVMFKCTPGRCFPRVFVTRSLSSPPLFFPSRAQNNHACANGAIAQSIACV